ncbi:hypothetical protein Bbelb_412830 [Branchiostoma belcheri]|nr:hypothetical protein Bbelb_412830 [Branchiostoma belcheri]
MEGAPSWDYMILHFSPLLFNRNESRLETQPAIGWGERPSACRISLRVHNIVGSFSRASQSSFFNIATPISQRTGVENGKITRTGFGAQGAPHATRENQAKWEKGTTIVHKLPRLATTAGTDIFHTDIPQARGRWGTLGILITKFSAERDIAHLLH